MIKSLKYILLFAIVIAKSGAVFGQGQNEIKDSLNYYLELAAKNNPTVLQRFYEYQAALQKVTQTGSLPDPELTLGVFLKPMELVMGKQAADIKLMQMFPWFGTLKAAKDEMSFMANAKYESFRDAKLQVFYDVQTTWYDLFKINQNIRISDKNLRILETIERLAQVRLRSSGSSGLSDIYRIQMEIGDLDNNIALLKDRKRTISAKFNSYINRPLQSALTVADTLTADTVIISLTGVSDSIQSNNPTLGMIQYEQQSLDARKKMVTRMGYPMLGVGVDYSLIDKSEMSVSPMNGNDMIMPMISATIPVYRKKYKAMQTEAELLKASVAQNYIATANSLQTEYYQAVQLYQDANRRMKLYSNQYQLAEKSLDIILKSFSASGSSLTDVLRMQQQALDYELKEVESVADYNSSIAWLKRLMART